MIAPILLSIWVLSGLAGFGIELFAISTMMRRKVSLPSDMEDALHDPQGRLFLIAFGVVGSSILGPAYFVFKVYQGARWAQSEWRESRAWQALTEEQRQELICERRRWR